MRSLYRCRHQIFNDGVQCIGQSTYTATKVEAHFEQQLALMQTILFQKSPTKLADLRFKTILLGMQEKRTGLAAEIQEIGKDQLSLAREYGKSLRGNAGLSTEQIAQMQDMLNQQKSDMEERLQEVEYQLEHTDIARQALHTSAEKAQNLLRQYQSGTIDVKKVILAQLLQKVELHQGYQVTLTLKPEIDILMNHTEVIYNA